MKGIYSLLLFLLLNNNALLGQNLPLSTTIDSAQYYYYKGWESVMDLGHYSNSAIAYRKCVAHDPDFLIGQCLYGRISDNLAEQKAIYVLVDTQKTKLSGAEYKLLEVYQALLKLMIVRQEDPEQAKEQVKIALTLGEENFRSIVHNYREEIYYKSEYIELLNYNHGAQVALDSLAVLATIDQQQNPFLLGYAAMLNAELGAFEIALAKAKELEDHFIGQAVPKPFVVYGDIFFKMKDFAKAKINVEKALLLDEHNIDALRLKKKLEAK